MTHKSSFATAAALGVAVGLAGAATAEENTNRWLTPTMITARAHMFSPQLNFMTFQHMDQMFATRTVAAGDKTWELPEKPVSLEGAYTILGETLDLEGALEKTSTNALLVIKDGAIVFERYRNGSGQNTQFLTFSVAKSYTSTLIGLALNDGLIDDLDDLVTKYLPEMVDSGYDGATIRDLLRMRSGVAWEERYEFGSETQLTKVHDNALVAYRYRWCDYAANESEKGASAPDEKFNYATLDTSVLGCIVERVTGRNGADYMSEKLWQPLGTQSDAYWIMDGPEDVGREFYGAGLAVTARDHARFGLMFLNGGIANGTQVLPEDWVTEATVPDEGYEPTEPGSPVGYQYQWWTETGTDVYMALGLHHQFIRVDPTNNTVIVKISYTAEPVGRDQENAELFGQITARLTQ
ncbi:MULTISPECIES: serine hydrolase domain-containing protein [Roseobacteraceae]|jgi:CubicO group peptidase (beta-lactamase class C family)|uniref:6-aminohexanoate-dimer hydrolase n=1 Tax=Pseudosulfitobacter pseudonitzschiae TaxID=1402135 RepID=A0A221JYB7_9RHOB|nr:MULTISPECIES: serine hydrolase [Roseobacteraceae]ASM71728.1 6-aminohexanoate-dimer hydrolase [Pseudosulfitobacter pseudonitzschiae]